MENNLDNQIAATSKNISDKTEELAKFKVDLQSFLDVNDSLNVAICQDVDDNLSPSELLAEIERLQALENARLQKLANVKKASNLLDSQIDKAANELEQLQKLLLRLNDEKDWQINYLPLADKYSKTFINDHKTQSDRKILDCNNQIANYKRKLEKIQHFIANPDPKIKQQSIKISDTEAMSYPDAERALVTIPVHIASCENSMNSEVDHYIKWYESLNNTPFFRGFVRARVQIDSAANDFKIATDNYLEKLQIFRSLIEDCKPAIQYNPSPGYHSYKIVSIEIKDYVIITDVETNV